jgi:hypothetical protein
VSSTHPQDRFTLERRLGLIQSGFSQPQLRRRCDSVLFWHIQHGHYGDIDLDDLSFVRVGRWEGDLWAGQAKGAAGIYIDERADER